jgi:hypothetical protein
LVPFSALSSRRGLARLNELVSSSQETTLWTCSSTRISWAYARQRHVIEWSLELPMIVNGKRLTMPIQGPTDLTFKTAGAEAPVRELLRSGSDWVPRDADEGTATASAD